MKKTYTYLLYVVLGVATLFQCQQKSKEGKTDEQTSDASSKQKVVTPTGTRFKHTKKDTAKIYTKKYKLSLPDTASLKNVYGAYASFSKLKTHFGFDTTDILKDGITIPIGAEGVGVFNALDNKGKHINYFVFTDIDTLSSGKKTPIDFTDHIYEIKGYSRVIKKYHKHPVILSSHLTCEPDCPNNRWFDN